MKAGENVEFNQSKFFKFIRELGSGGTGVTNLFKDETTDTLFAIKKYQPSKSNSEYEEDFYLRFVDEIKILFQLSHPNIVRVYNYYLYPQYTLGYLQMEYIEGVPIDEYVDNNIVDLNQLFRSVIDAFVCLEDNNILHRDIRPANIMVDNDGQIKVIDFGFSKILDSDNSENSIYLNWPATEFPNEVINSNEYTSQTEIYFLGYLFRKLIQLDSNEDFKFSNVLEKMCEVDSKNRYENFENISADIAKGVLSNMSFTEEEKNIYLNMAESLMGIIIRFYGKFTPAIEVNKVLNDLEIVLKSSILEDFIQNNDLLVEAFVDNSYTCSSNHYIRVSTVEKFYRMFLNSDYQKKKIILENLKMRLSKIDIRKDPFDFSDDDLPF
ncbi:protein kinase family protein [Enterococcus sp. BWB1-3]|uniref:protein kinase family protein n=1 Tax=Enterococcus sp. BWB1-3 TaxID=2787713 RepID=UPI0019225FF8|nr:protein kinase family protein [Enterococcus sp. BWB1-3]MBL1230314.1 protein kinase family protein [Enterococcus sp. BWB1-3]